MINLYDLPNSTSGEYIVFFDNISGAASMITIMRKDLGDITPHCRTMMAAFIDVPISGDEPRFSWHNNSELLPFKPFTKEWCVDQYSLHRTRALQS